MNAAGQATTVHSTGDKGAASLEHKLPLKKRGKGSGTERQHRLQNKQPKSFPRCTFSSQTEQAFASPSAVERHALTVCYLCETAPVKGKFYPQRALALGVPKGPLFGKLSSGNTVTLEDGTTVRPEDVMDASIPGRAVLVIACPSLDMVPTVTQHAALAPFAKPGIDSERLQCVIHMTPQHVIEDSRYTAWMRAFVQPVTHIVVSASCSWRCIASAAHGGLTPHCLMGAGQQDRVLAHASLPLPSAAAVQVPRHRQPPLSPALPALCTASKGCHRRRG